jgi:hypothetical protein
MERSRARPAAALTHGIGWGALALGVLAPLAAPAAPVEPGTGLQRHFVWHTGTAEVKSLPLGDPVFLEVTRPICLPGQTPGQSPNFCFNPGQPLSAANLPTRLVLVREPDSPALVSLFALEGADAILGPNPFQNDAVDDPFAYLGSGEPVDRANPLRGPRPPTGNGLVSFVIQLGPRTNEPFSYRWTELDDERRAFFPAAISPPASVPFGFDRVDPRIAFDATGDGVSDAGQAFANLSDYPNGGAVRSLVNELARVGPFGGDFSGIVPCEQPDVQPASSAQNQIATGTTSGCWTNLFDTVLPPPGTPRGFNVANTGGRGELPLRPAPDRSSRDDLAAGSARGLDHAEPPGLSFAREVDSVSGRPLVRGPAGVGRCRSGAPIFARTTLLTYPQGPNGPAVPSGPNVFESGNPEAVIGPGIVPYWNALAPMMGGLGVGTDPDCLKPGGTAGGPNANLLDVANAVDLDGDTVPDAIYNASFTGPRPSPENALEHHPANQSLFAWLCELTIGWGPSLDARSCLGTLFNSPNQGFSSPPTGPGTILSETFSATFAGESSNAIVGNLGLLSIIQTNQKSAAELPVPLQAMNRDLRDGVNTSLGLIFRNVPIGNPERAYTPDSVFNLLSLDSVMTAEQRALLGCGPFFGTRCDSSRLDRAALAGFPAGSGVGFPEGGGIDFLNTEASALTQSFPGIPGTEDGWTTTSRTLREDDDPLTEMMIQPGTIGFENEAYCTRYDPKNDLANDLGLVRLPGCRGIVQRLTEDLAALAPGEEIEFLFEPGYTPQVDGCVLGVSNPNDAASRGVAINGHPVRALRIRPRNDPNFDPNDPVGSAEDITLLLDATCGGEAGGVVASSTRIGVPGRASASLFRSFAQTAWHPLAGCKTWAQAHDPSDAVRRCNFSTRNFEQEYFAGTAQIFRNEMAVFSWNFLQFLVIASCDSARGGDDLNDPDCFDPRPATFDGMGNLIAGNAAWAPDRCSLAAPQYCRNVKGFLSVAGLQRNDVRAGGTTRFGRLDFVWHSGGELVLEYARRNVFGFSADFAEDVTKTNWGMEFTWFTDVPFVNNDDFYNVSDSQILNLTVSVDRPTFINFLNANRTFFINSQWFFQYLTDYQGGGFTSNGPFNVLFTVAVFTGYFQDRLNPQWVFVYDFGSRSGGLLPTLGYRFTENFSATIGFNYFFGRGQLKSMPVRGFAPATNRAGENRYRDGVENVLAAIRHRDEVFFRLRYTF